MKILPEPINFDWDKGNIEKNQTKHNVSLREAEEIYSDKKMIVSEDLIHSDDEKRYQTLGKTNRGRLLFLSFTL